MVGNNILQLCGSSPDNLIAEYKEGIRLADSSIQRLKERLTKLLHQHDLATQKSKMLEEQTERDKQREQMLTDLTHQLMDRQRELNVMLNRANIMLNRAQEANTILSLEFTELCHALPAPEDPEVQDRIHRINDLFRNTGITDAEVAISPEKPSESAIVTPPPTEPQEVTVAAYVVEEAVEPAGNGAKTPTSGEAKLDELFGRTGDEDIPQKPSARPARPARPPIIDEPMPEYQPAFRTEPDFVVPQMPSVEPEPEPEPVGVVASADTSSFASSGRRWWQLLGNR
jgi:hypothetical protein